MKNKKMRLQQRVCNHNAVKERLYCVLLTPIYCNVNACDATELLPALVFRIAQQTTKNDEEIDKT